MCIVYRTTGNKALRTLLTVILICLAGFAGVRAQEAADTAAPQRPTKAFRDSTKALRLEPVKATKDSIRQEPERLSVGDSVRVYLVTCSPGTDEIYSLFGHTAIEVVDERQQTPDEMQDRIFNYGVFNSYSSHFVWNFMLGKTDYTVQSLPYSAFKREYERRGSSIIRQRVNLTPDEALAVHDILYSTEYKAYKQGWTYRYNYLTKNCTTMVRDVIEEALRMFRSEVKYKERKQKPTYREAMHQYTAVSPWGEAGIDLLLGAECDTILSDQTSDFLPESLDSYFNDAVIYDSLTNARPLMLGQREVMLPEREVQHEDGFPLPPLHCSLILIGILLLIMGLEYWLKRQFWLFDALFMLGSGAAGLLITFMAFCSEHPTLASNWQVWVFNPLPLIGMPWVVWCGFKHRRCAFHYVYAVLLAAFLVAFPWIPQQFSIVTLPVTVALLTRPVSYIVNHSRMLKRVEQRKAKRDKNGKGKAAEEAEGEDTAAKAALEKVNTAGKKKKNRR